jgi:hypothetical protein
MKNLHNLIHYSQGNKLVDVAIELGLSEKQATRYYTEYWKLKGLYELHSIYEQLKGKPLSCSGAIQDAKERRNRN